MIPKYFRPKNNKDMRKYKQEFLLFVKQIHTIDSMDKCESILNKHGLTCSDLFSDNKEYTFYTSVVNNSVDFSLLDIFKASFFMNDTQYQFMFDNLYKNHSGSYFSEPNVLFMLDNIFHLNEDEFESGFIRKQYHICLKFFNWLIKKEQNENIIQSYANLFTFGLKACSKKGLNNLSYHVTSFQEPEFDLLNAFAMQLTSENQKILYSELKNNFRDMSQDKNLHPFLFSHEYVLSDFIKLIHVQPEDDIHNRVLLSEYLLNMSHLERYFDLYGTPLFEKNIGQNILQYILQKSEYKENLYNIPGILMVLGKAGYFAESRLLENEINSVLSIKNTYTNIELLNTLYKEFNIVYPFQFKKDNQLVNVNNFAGTNNELLLYFTSVYMHYSASTIHNLMCQTLYLKKDDLSEAILNTIDKSEFYPFYLNFFSTENAVKKNIQNSDDFSLKLFTIEEQYSMAKCIVQRMPDYDLNNFQLTGMKKNLFDFVIQAEKEQLSEAVNMNHSKKITISRI